VSAARRQAILAILAALALALAVIVIVRNRSPDDELLAVVGLLGGAAMLVVSLPGAGPDRPPGPDG
jgi:drug/metabolite transporter (DMT)-like permease